MGLSIDQRSFTDADYGDFSRRLDESLQVLRQLLQREGFGVGPATLGAELELYLIDGEARPALLNSELLAAAGDDRLTLELNRYNLEYNADWSAMAGTPFTALASEFEAALTHLRGAAAPCGVRPVAIGILPTLTGQDFGRHVMTDVDRYHALTHSLLGLRGGKPFAVAIDGPEPLAFEADHVTYEGANTSLQLHWRVSPAEFNDCYNAVQLATPVVLALSANSPLLLGHRLWAETRIALFKQSIDSRDIEGSDWQLPARVSFRQGWLRDGAYELFAEAVRLYQPLLPVCGPQSPLSALADGEIPELAELRLHESTIWHWNRPVFDPAAGGHLRIELRTLPAGPTIIDMVANSAWLLGLAAGLQSQLDDLLPAVPFELARRNFYAAARDGFAASLIWPLGRAPAPRELPIAELARHLRPTVADGLARLGLDPVEADYWMARMDDRLAVQRNGAGWQLEALARLERRMSRDSALRAMLELYVEQQIEGRPIAEWRLPR